MVDYIIINSFLTWREKISIRKLSLLEKVIQNIVHQKSELFKCSNTQMLICSLGKKCAQFEQII